MKVSLKLAQRRLDITENILETRRIGRIKKSMKNETEYMKKVKELETKIIDRKGKEDPTHQRVQIKWNRSIFKCII